MSELFIGIKCVLRIFDKHGCTYWRIKNNSAFLISTQSCQFLHQVLYPLSYVWYHWNPESVCNKKSFFFFFSLFYLYWYFLIWNLFWHTDKNFCFYASMPKTFFIWGYMYPLTFIFGGTSKFLGVQCTLKLFIWGYKEKELHFPHARSYVSVLSFR